MFGGLTHRSRKVDWKEMLVEEDYWGGVKRNLEQLEEKVLAPAAKRLKVITPLAHGGRMLEHAPEPVNAHMEQMAVLQGGCAWGCVAVFAEPFAESVARMLNPLLLLIDSLRTTLMMPMEAGKIVARGMILMSRARQTET